MDGDLFSWTFKIEDYEYDLLYEKLIKQYPEACFVCVDHLTFAMIRLTLSNTEHYLCRERIFKHYITKTKLDLELGVSHDILTGKIIFDSSKITEKTAKLRDVYLKFLMSVQETLDELDFLYRTAENSSADCERLLKNVQKCKTREEVRF